MVQWTAFMLFTMYNFSYVPLLSFVWGQYIISNVFNCRCGTNVALLGRNRDNEKSDWSYLQFPSDALAHLNYSKCHWGTQYVLFHLLMVLFDHGDHAGSRWHNDTCISLTVLRTNIRINHITSESWKPAEEDAGGLCHTLCVSDSLHVIWCQVSVITC